jgi:hypothetical protein
MTKRLHYHTNRPVSVTIIHLLMVTIDARVVIAGLSEVIAALSVNTEQDIWDNQARVLQK